MILKLLVQLKWRDTIICLFLICGNNSSRKTLSFEGCLYSDKFSSFFKWNTLELFPSVGLNSTWAHKHQSDACERAAQLLCVVTCAGRQSSLQQATAQLNTPRTWTSTTQHNTFSTAAQLSLRVSANVTVKLYLPFLRLWLTPPSPHTPPSGTRLTSERTI